MHIVQWFYSNKHTLSLTHKHKDTKKMNININSFCAVAPFYQTIYSKHTVKNAGAKSGRYDKQRRKT